MITHPLPAVVITNHDSNMKAERMINQNMNLDCNQLLNSVQSFSHS